MVIKRVDPVSAAKIGGVLYGLLGLLIGACISVVALLFSGALSSLSDQPGGSVFGMLFGAGAVVIMPIFYGVVGFVMTLISAALFNVAAKMTGGVQVDAA